MFIIELPGYTLCSLVPVSSFFYKLNLGPLNMILSNPKFDFHIGLTIFLLFLNEFQQFLQVDINFS